MERNAPVPHVFDLTCSECGADGFVMRRGDRWLCETHMAPHAGDCLACAFPILDADDAVRGEPIAGVDAVIDLGWHYECFACAVCCKELHQAATGRLPLLFGGGVHVRPTGVIVSAGCCLHYASHSHGSTLVRALPLSDHFAMVAGDLVCGDCDDLVLDDGQSEGSSGRSGGDGTAPDGTDFERRRRKASRKLTVT